LTIFFPDNDNSNTALMKKNIPEMAKTISFIQNKKILLTNKENKQRQYN